MLYCIQVSPTQEIKTEKEINAIIPPEICGPCFHLSRRRWRRYHGNRHLVTERLLPGYIFLESDHVDELYELLRKVPTLTKLLNFKNWGIENNSDGFSQLDDGEEALIRRLAMGEGEAGLGMIDVSGLEIRKGNMVHVVSGPLMGLESRISKIDLHHGTAMIGVKILGKTVDMLVGVEDLSRTLDWKPVRKKKHRRRSRRVPVSPAEE